MKLITKLSYSEKLRFPDRIIKINDKLIFIAKNEYTNYVISQSDNLIEQQSYEFPSFDEIYLAEFQVDGKFFTVTKTDKFLFVYELTQHGYLEIENTLPLEEDNITVFVSDDQSFVAIYNVQDLVVYKSTELLNKRPEVHSKLGIDEKSAILKLVIYQGFMYALLNVEKSPYIGRVHLAREQNEAEAFELKLLNYKASHIAVCGSRLCVYADDESNDMFIYNIEQLFNGKISIDSELFKHKKIYVNQLEKLFLCDENIIGTVQRENKITLIDTQKLKRIMTVEFNNVVDFDLSEVVDAITLGNNALLVKTLNELLLYDINTSGAKVLARFKEVFEEVIDLSQ